MSTLLIRDAPLLDLTDPDVRERLNVTREELLDDDDLTAPQQFADRARGEGLAGVIGPSASDPRDPAAATIVIFHDHLDVVTVEDESVGPFPEEFI
jgi:hypothetical protein